MRKEKDKFYSPARKILLLIMALGMAGCAIFGLLYKHAHAGWMLSCAITSGLFAYHIMLRFISPVILFFIFHKKYNYKAKWFQEKPWEKRLYDFLKVKKWKNRVMTYNPGDFSLEIHSFDEIVNNMCAAEAVHELIVVLCFTSVLFAIPFGAFPVFFITAVLSALIDCVFVIIQRYNRPRLVRIMEKRKPSMK